MTTTAANPRHEGPVDIERLDPVLFDLSVGVGLWSGEFEHSTWRMRASLLAPEGAEDENAREQIFTMDGWMFPVSLGGRLAGLLDDNADSAEFLPLADEFGLLAEYESGVGSQLVIANRARLEPRWRGLGGVGRYLAGMGFLMLRDWATCIALHPAPFELKKKYGDGEVPDEEWKAGTTRLTKLWRTLGCETAPGGNLVLDPSLNRLDKAVARLAKKLGLGPPG